MANFVLLYSGGSTPETQAEQAEVTQAWGAWIGKIGSSLVDSGNPFTPVAKTIHKDGKVSDGVAGPLATGYSVIKADSLDAAVEMAKDCPIFLGGGHVSVYETYPVM